MRGNTWARAIQHSARKRHGNSVPHLPLVMVTTTVRQNQSDTVP